MVYSFTFSDSNQDIPQTQQAWHTLSIDRALELMQSDRTKRMSVIVDNSENISDIEHKNFVTRQDKN